MLKSVIENIESSDRSLQESRFPKKAMDFNKVDNPDAFWKYDVEEAAKNNALRPFGGDYPKDIGDVIFWLNQVASNWNDGIGIPSNGKE